MHPNFVSWMYKQPRLSCQLYIYITQGRVPMTKTFIGGLVALCIIAFNASASYSQVPMRTGCKDLAEAKVTIQEKHGEQIVFRGISARGHVTFIFLTATSGTWTAAIVRPEASQLLCWVDSGFTGESIDKKASKSW